MTEARVATDGTHHATPEAGSRLPWISLVRLLAILGVVLIHVSGLTYGRAAAEGSLTRSLAGILDFSQLWAVPGFVIASGATLLGPRASDPGSFLRKRLGRILVPLVVWHVVYIVFTRSVLGWDPGWGSILGSLLQGRTYTALYFFWLILGLYVAAPVLWSFLEGMSVRARWTVALVMISWSASTVSINAYLDRLGIAPVGGRMNILTIFLPYLGYFVAGLALRDTPVRSRWIAPLLAVAVVSGALSIMQVMGIAGTGVLFVIAPPRYDGLGVAMYALSIVAVLKAVADRWGVLRSGAIADVVDRWGRRTLGIFATHLLVLYYAQRVTGTWPDGARTGPGMLGLFVVTVIGSAVVTAALSRVPFVRRSVV